MNIKYHLRDAKKTGDSFLVILMPADLIKQCNFEHRDAFIIDITDKSIIMKYDTSGAYKLSKNGRYLAFNINVKVLDKKVVGLLRIKTDKSLPIQISGNKLIADLTKLSDGIKGFNLFNVVNKGFGLVSK